MQHDPRERALVAEPFDVLERSLERSFARGSALVTGFGVGEDNDAVGERLSGVLIRQRHATDFV